MDEQQTIYRSSNVLPGWNFGGYVNYNSGYRTTHWRENSTSGGNGAILGFDLMKLTDDGTELARAMIEWCLDGEIDRRMIVESESVLVIRSSDTATPTLTALESAANDLLLASGLDVVYISKAQIGTTNLSRANGVFLTEGHVSSTVLNRWISERTRVGLIYTGGGSLGGGWTWHNNDNTRRYTATGSDGFNNHFVGTQFWGQNTGSVYAMYTAHPSGLIRDGHGYYAHYWTGGHRTDATSGGGVAFLTFHPQDLTSAGEALYANMIAWVVEGPYPMFNASANKVAFVINNYDESGSTLSTREAALRDNLTANGLSVDYVSHVNSSRTDFSRSLF
ncbi:MAG: hypothetical protein KAS77_11515, partial [Thermoplasmata archaeon]|nr:hypothetical protein [Thermoplasmata archaeon]